MLSGPELGDALRRAIELKGVTKAEVARHFHIRQPSIYDWLKHGRIGKQHLDELVAYFADVVPPQHWGISANAFSGVRESSVSTYSGSSRISGRALRVAELFDMLDADEKDKFFRELAARAEPVVDPPRSTAKRAHSAAMGRRR